MPPSTPRHKMEPIIVVPCSQETDSGSQTSSRPDSPTPENAPKKRTPKPRDPPQTIVLREGVDASSDPLYPQQKKAVEKLIKVLAKKKKIVVIAGAGISVGSGIPDFRSSNGLFTTLRSENKLKSSGKDLFDSSVYKDNDATASFHKMIRELHAKVQKAEPSRFHHLLASLAKEGRLLRLYSQNVDCIDTSMEPLETRIPLQRQRTWPQTVQLHGALETMVCSRCHFLGKLEPNLFDGPTAPDCTECEEADGVRNIAGKRSLGIGKLRPRMVLYNEENPDADAIGAVTEADLKSRPDAVIVVGTSLKIPGVRRIVREMCSVTRDMRGGVTIWINSDEPPTGPQFDGIFDIIVQGDCQRLEKLAGLPRHDGSTPPPDPTEPPSSPKQMVAVVIPPTPSKQRTLLLPGQGHQSPTPISSPVLSSKSVSNSSDSAKRTNKRKSPTKELKTKATKKKKVERDISNSFKNTKAARANNQMARIEEAKAAAHTQKDEQLSTEETKPAPIQKQEPIKTEKAEPTSNQRRISIPNLLSNTPALSSLESIYVPIHSMASAD